MDQAFDAEGFLISPAQWTPELGKAIASAEGIALDGRHWEIIELVRNFYKEYELSPVNRSLVKYTQLQLGEDKGNSLYLNSLFAGSPAKLAAKIAGLPKPTNCL
jgi:tRNA 2-thiouridine synthesizing protein E